MLRPTKKKFIQCDEFASISVGWAYEWGKRMYIVHHVIRTKKNISKAQQPIFRHNLWLKNLTFGISFNLCVLISLSFTHPALMNDMSNKL